MVLRSGYWGLSVVHQREWMQERQGHKKEASKGETRLQVRSSPLEPHCSWGESQEGSERGRASMPATLSCWGHAALLEDGHVSVILASWRNFFQGPCLLRVRSGLGEVSRAQVPTLPAAASSICHCFSAQAPVLLTGLCWDRVFDIFISVFLLSPHSTSPPSLLPVEMIHQES